MSAWSIRWLGIYVSAAVSVLGCTAETTGYGDAGFDEATGSPEDSGSEADPSGDGDSSGDGDPSTDTDDTDDTDSTDTDTDVECLDVTLEDPVTIQMLSIDPLDPCVELNFTARVDAALVGIYGIRACDCDVPEPQCMGEKFELTLDLPDADWMPALELGSCHRFALYSEPAGPGVCRRSRIDISADATSIPWYSLGSAREDLDHAGVSVTPIAADKCEDGCGAWQLRDLRVSVGGAEQTLAWGESTSFGDAEAIHWRSWVSPFGCGGSGEDRSAWTLRSSPP